MKKRSVNMKYGLDKDMMERIHVFWSMDCIMLIWGCDSDRIRIVKRKGKYEIGIWMGEGTSSMQYGLWMG